MLKTIDEKLFSFNNNGFVVYEQAISHDLIERFSQEFHYLLAQKKPLNINISGNFIKRDKITSETELEEMMKFCRFIDVENFSALSRELILFPQISQFLTSLYQGTKPTNLQTLTYKYSSQQGEHSDFYLVAPPWVGNYNRSTLTAAWIALEDADESNGALIIYPQSHLISNKKRLLEDFDNNYAEYVDYLKQICKENNIQAEYFYAKKGDILFWHGDFIHAGGMIEDFTKTRFSLVCHYANLDKNHDFLLPKEHEHYRQRVYYKDLGYLYLSCFRATLKTVQVMLD